MKTKQVLAIIFTTSGLGLLLAGCCCSPKVDLNNGIPLITHQPEDTEVTTNKDTTLTVDIKREDNYRFAWFRQVPASCLDRANVGAVTFNLQTNRPGWDTSALQIQNATTNDEGNYLCVITHEQNSIPPAEVETQTRLAYLKVYQAQSLHGETPHMFMISQVASRQLSGTQPCSTKVCDLSGYNVAFTFKKDDNANPFISPATNSTCEITVNTVNPDGSVNPALNPTQYTVVAFPLKGTVPSGASTCTTTNALPGRQFSAPPSTNYWLVLYIGNAPATGATYQLHVSFH